MAARRRFNDSSLSMESSSEDEVSYGKTWKRTQGNENSKVTSRRAGGRAACSSKNAIMARVNRIKKKMYIGGLEEQIAALKTENRRARVMLGTQAERIEELDREVAYLRGVLGNVPEIARLVRGLRQGLEGAAPPPSSLWGELPEEPLELPLLPDHTYTSPFLSASAPSPTPGVCFHIANKHVSLEFCAKCNDQAIANWEGVTCQDL